MVLKFRRHTFTLKSGFACFGMLDGAEYHRLYFGKRFPKIIAEN
jgi:hypothetical protein